MSLRRAKQTCSVIREPLPYSLQLVRSRCRVIVLDFFKFLAPTTFRIAAANPTSMEPDVHVG